ncbi:replication protein A1-like protein, partial [Trifolium medium]|nr:replication protein A1-like protein [Trifolium medium]
VIGGFKQMTYSQQHAGPKKICAAFTVVDSSGVELSCTLWGNFATTLFNYLNGRTNNEPVVIIIKHGKIKDASDSYAVSIGNAWNGTKVFIDADYDDAKKIANR